jgi:hypothetical protein
LKDLLDFLAKERGLRFIRAETVGVPSIVFKFFVNLQILGLNIVGQQASVGAGVWPFSARAASGPPDRGPKQHLHEIENDLIAGHYHSHGSPPVMQFRNTKVARDQQRV